MFSAAPIKKGRFERKRSLKKRSLLRSGIATIETAVVLPVVVFITFGSIELSNLMFVRQSLTIAAYEAARACTKPGGSQGLGDARAHEVLNARGITSFNVNYTPVVTLATPRGTLIKVTVSTNTSNVSYAPFQLFTGSTISSSSAMVHQ
jgi:Flp pilus assembly protein TadG